MQRIQGWAEQGGVHVAIEGPPGPPGPPGPQGPPGSTISAMLGPGYVSACDFPGADASLKIQAAYAALPATGGTVDGSCLLGAQVLSVNPFAGGSKPVELILGEGIYTHAGVWDMPANSVLRGKGWNTILRATTAASSAIRALSVSNVQISNLRLDYTGGGSSQAQAASKILISGSSNVEIDHVWITGSANFGILFVGSALCRAHDNLLAATDYTSQCTFKDGIHVTGQCTRIAVHNNIAVHTGDDSFSAVSYISDTGVSTYVSFIGNHSYNSASRAVTNVGSQYVEIISNVCSNPASHGIGVLYDPGFATLPALDTVVANNIIAGVTGASQNSIIVAGAAGNTVRRVNITGNIISGSNTMLIDGGAGAVGVQDIHVGNNRISNTNANSYGVNFNNPGTQEFSCCDNRIDNTGAGSAIVVSGASSGQISGNTIYNSSPAGSVGSIDISNATGVIGFGNLVQANAGGGVSIRVFSSTNCFVSSLDQKNQGFPFWGANGFAPIATSHLNWDDVNRYLGINVATPGTQLDVRSTAPANYGILTLANSDATFFLSLFSGNSGSQNQFFGFNGASLQFGTEGNPSGGGFTTVLSILPRALKIAPQTFASLPTVSPGLVAFISDSTTTTAGAVISGGGTSNVLAYSDGTHWLVA